MAPQLSPTTRAAIDWDIIIASTKLNQQEIKQLAASYRYSLRTIYQHQRRIQVGRPVPAQTGSQHRVIMPEMDTTIFHLLNTFLCSTKTRSLSSFLKSLV